MKFAFKMGRSNQCLPEMVIAQGGINVLSFRQPSFDLLIILSRKVDYARCSSASSSILLKLRSPVMFIYGFSVINMELGLGLGYQLELSELLTSRSPRLRSIRPWKRCRDRFARRSRFCLEDIPNILL